MLDIRQFNDPSRLTSDEANAIANQLTAEEDVGGWSYDVCQAPGSSWYAVVVSDEDGKTLGVL